MGTRAIIRALKVLTQINFVAECYRDNVSFIFLKQRGSVSELPFGDIGVTYTYAIHP